MNGVYYTLDFLFQLIFSLGILDRVLLKNQTIFLFYHYLNCLYCTFHFYFQIIFSLDVLDKISLVFDLVYNPPVTELMEAARDAGLQAVGGGSMLIEQAVLSRAIWFGEEKIEEERAAMVAAYSSWATKTAREK